MPPSIGVIAVTMVPRELRANAKVATSRVAANRSVIPVTKFSESRKAESVEIGHSPPHIDVLLRWHSEWPAAAYYPRADLANPSFVR